MPQDTLRHKKITLLFLILDADENGFLEEKDFRNAAERLAALRNWSQYSDDAKLLRQAFISIYEDIIKRLDLNTNRFVELEEWLAYFDQLFEEAADHTRIIDPIATQVFRLLDQNSDGMISKQELHEFSTVYRIPTESVDELFDRLDRDADGTISTAEYREMIFDFFLSNDPSKAGNYIFGQF
ncbi:MAG: EF-hand domain-containing protein [Phototrophicaceae bacterium]|jgi:Ca2+-binding EF-hand superfamily protein